MTEKPMKLIKDCTTGEEQYIELTDEEIAEAERARIASEEEMSLQEQAQAEKAAARKSAEEKLAALGLTPEEISAMLG